LRESAENSQTKSIETAEARAASATEETFVPGRPPDPSLTRVGSSNACPGCQSAEIRTLCRGEDFLCRATERLFLVVECKACGMVRLYPRPDPEELRRFYPPQGPTDASGEAPGFWSDLLRRFLLRDHARFVRGVLAEVPGDGPVLDVNCGAGLLLRELNLPQRRLVGLDFSPDSAATAWTRNAVPAVCGALPSAPFSAGTFSLITMFQVLEHLYDPSVYIETAAQLLRPEGHLIVQVPNASSWQFLLLGERWSGLDIPRHLLLFKREDLENLLEFCGFEIVHRKRFSLRDDPLMLAKSLAPGLSPEVRHMRGTEENQVAAIVKSILFGLLWLVALPVAALESACGGGASLTIDARLKRVPPDPS
jgi:SAM-dependent methyltransferase